MDALTAELSERGKDIPAHVDTILTALPPGTHPMTQFSTAVLALQVMQASARSTQDRRALRWIDCRAKPQL